MPHLLQRFPEAVCSLVEERVCLSRVSCQETLHMTQVVSFVAGVWAASVMISTCEGSSEE